MSTRPPSSTPIDTLAREAILCRVDRPARQLLLACAVAVFGACDGDDTSSSPDAGPTAAAFVDQSPRVDCERQVRCAANPPASVDACLQDYDAGIERAGARKVQSVADGRMRYSPKDANACLDAQAGSCGSAMTDILAICNQVFVGTQAVGEPCRGHFDCDRSHATLTGPYCFEGCQGLDGTEETEGHGICVETSPIGTPACAGTP